MQLLPGLCSLRSCYSLLPHFLRLIAYAAGAGLIAGHSHQSMRDNSLSATVGLASGRASMAPGGHSLRGAENECVLTCSDGFEAAEDTEAEASVSRQLLAGQHGESCHHIPTEWTFPPSPLCGRRLLLLMTTSWRLGYGFPNPLEAAHQASRLVYAT